MATVIIFSIFHSSYNNFYDLNFEWATSQHTRLNDVFEMRTIFVSKHADYRLMPKMIAENIICASGGQFVVSIELNFHYIFWTLNYSRISRISYRLNNLLILVAWQQHRLLVVTLADGWNFLWEFSRWSESWWLSGCAASGGFTLLRRVGVVLRRFCWKLICIVGIVVWKSGFAAFN